MHSPDPAARIAELEAENARLRAGREMSATSLTRARGGRAVLATALIVVGLVLGTISVGASYARNLLTDTDLFVSTLAPLADDPHVQAVVIGAVTEAIEESVDIPALTASAFDGLGQADLPPRAKAALDLLRGPINRGLQSLIDGFVTDFIESRAFSDIWATALRGTHTQLIATMQDDPGSAVTISPDGALELQLGPIIADVRSRLIANDVRIAEGIPAIDRSIVIVRQGSLGALTTVYALIVAMGSWLPWAALALLAAGVLSARHRRRALITTAISAAVLMGVLGVALAVGRTVLVGTLSGGPVTPAAVDVVYRAVTASVASTVLAVAALAIILVIIAWMSGRTRAAELLRASVGHVADAARTVGDRYGVSTSEPGRWLDRHHTLVAAAICVAAAAVILFTRPLAVGTILWTVAIAALTLLLVQFLRRPESVQATKETQNE